VAAQQMTTAELVSIAIAKTSPYAV
jgi:hypothetical protein